MIGEMSLISISFNLCDLMTKQPKLINSYKLVLVLWGCLFGPIDKATEWLRLLLHLRTLMFTFVLISLTATATALAKAMATIMSTTTSTITLLLLLKLLVWSIWTLWTLHSLPTGVPRIFHQLESAFSIMIFGDLLKNFECLSKSSIMTS